MNIFAGFHRIAPAVVVLLLPNLRIHAQESSPITIAPQVREAAGQRELMLSFHVPEHNHLYADRLSVEIAGVPASVKCPNPVMELDKHSGKTRGMYVSDFTATVPLSSMAADV